jgi:hypothetical protein
MLVTAEGVSFNDLGALSRALAEAARTDESNADQAVNRFVELRPGISDRLLARRHHLLTGRRGTGKSTLLHKVRNTLHGQGKPVAVIDMEQHKGRPFPDVLIEILIALLDEIKPEIRIKSLIPDLRLRGQFRKSRDELSQLLLDPQRVQRTVDQSSKSSTKVDAATRAKLRLAHGPVSGEAAGSASASTESERAESRTAEFDEFKIERLQQLASKLSNELKRLVSGAASEEAIIFIDDFHFVSLEDQPAVLDYLHQVVKNTGIWLKIVSVGARNRPYREDDPPIGMQPSQDIDALSIDVTLSDFGTAQRFLEEMMDGILKPLGLSTSVLLTDGARPRMVLACGGAVARDYVTLLSAAIDHAVERTNKSGRPAEDARLNVQAEDVQQAAHARVGKKEAEELALDAGQDASSLRSRWRDIIEFARAQGNTAFILVRQQDLDEAQWGDEIKQLENLRLLHRIGDTVPNVASWRGVKTVVFLMDIGQLSGARLRTSIPEFWKGTREFDRLRRAEWVYGPQWQDKLRTKPKRPRRTVAPAVSPTESEPEEEPAWTLFDNPTDLDS